MPGRQAAGRGAVSNPGVRFDAHTAFPFDDGWETLTQDIGDLPRLDTSLTRDSTRSAISWNTSPDIGFDRAVNPYRGCEHGCIYCYARPTHAYLGYSPGLDFETKLIFKPDVAELLEKELRKPGYVARTLALGSNTDPYQPVERTLKLTRSVLEVLDRFNHPVGIVTKSAGVLRDLDILSSMAQRNLVRVHLSVTTLDPRLARVMEPRAATPARRLQAVAELTRAGVPAGRAGRADDPRAERRGDGEDPGSRGGGRSAPRRLHPAAPAAGTAADVRGVAADAFPRPGAACAQPDPADPRGGAERPAVPSPVHRPWPVCRFAGPAIRQGVAAVRVR